jgi:hypothetical protein
MFLRRAEVISEIINECEQHKYKLKDTQHSL